DVKVYEELKAKFGLNGKKSMTTFSKGMKRQAVTILAMACRTEYIFFDETFDGLDPIMRNLVKSILCKDVIDRGATAIITSHSLRELEDTCDQLAFLHKGGLVLQSSLGKLKTDLFKVQVAFDREYNREDIERMLSGLTGDGSASILHFVKHGRVINVIIRGAHEAVMAALEKEKPILIESIPLTLEEVFTYEMESRGYSFETVLSEKEADHE
ncbi:MAG: ABC transporter ATP-binding protein, partial [Lachnospiraceae bacterium]|nr:ABC transporter ATP-binding protein [Lachnospiraceae bacterium]